MRADIIAKRYAKGLFEAIDSNNYEKIKEELTSFLKIYNTDKELKPFLENPFYTKYRKIEVMREILKHIDYSEEVKSFINLLTEKNRISFLPYIIDEFIKIWEENNNVYPVDIYTSTKIDSTLREKIISVLEKKFKGKISPRFFISEELIGGILIKHKSTYYDGSVKGILNNLKEKIIKES